MSASGTNLTSLPTAYWHTTALHYVPYLLMCGSLFSQDRLAATALPIRPRPTAQRRDRKLGLTGFIHLSFVPRTPLLADKIARGYPHVLLEFVPAIADLPGAAYIPYNAKAWRHRDDFIPLTSPDRKAALLEAWRSGSFPSAELLIPGMLPLTPHLMRLHAMSEAEADWLQSFQSLIADIPVIQVSPDLFYTSTQKPVLLADRDGYEEYLTLCLAANEVLPPPDLPFD